MHKLRGTSLATIKLWEVSFLTATNLPQTGRLVVFLGSGREHKPGPLLRFVVRWAWFEAQFMLCEDIFLVVWTGRKPLTSSTLEIITKVYGNRRLLSYVTKRSASVPWLRNHSYVPTPETDHQNSCILSYIGPDWTSCAMRTDPSTFCFLAVSYLLSTHLLINKPSCDKIDRITNLQIDAARIRKIDKLQLQKNLVPSETRTA